MFLHLRVRHHSTVRVKTVYMVRARLWIDCWVNCPVTARVDVGYVPAVVRRSDCAHNLAVAVRLHLHRVERFASLGEERLGCGGRATL